MNKRELKFNKILKNQHSWCIMFINVNKTCGTRKITSFQKLWPVKHPISYLQSEATTRGAPKKKGVLEYFSKFTGKRLCQSLLFIKKETLAQVFSWEFGRLLLLQKNIFVDFPNLSSKKLINFGQTNKFCVVLISHHEILGCSGLRCGYYSRF